VIIDSEYSAHSLSLTSWILWYDALLET
jgi:hypothetical protein